MTDFSIANWNGWVDGWMGGIQIESVMCWPLC